MRQPCDVSRIDVRESGSLFRFIADTAPVMIWMSGVDKLCIYFNQRWLDFTGRSVEAEMGSGWTDGVHREDLAHCLETYSTAFDRRAPFRMTYRLRRNDGEYRWILDQGVPRFELDGSFAGYIGSCVDITEQKLAEEARSKMSQKLVEAQEQERRWLARELHDDISQRISLLALTLQSLQQNPPSSRAVLRKRLGEEFTRVSELASDIDALSHRLHSPTLRNTGLATAAALFCREMADLKKIEIDFHASKLPSDLAKPTEVCLFRVLQEALHNAVKHSGSRHIEVSLRGSLRQIELTVRDWGCGFVPEEAAEGSGLGLVNMRERLKLIGGKFSIDSQVGVGTTIRAAAPLDLASEPARE